MTEPSLIQALPTPRALARDEVINILERTLAEAREGKIQSIILLAYDGSGKWANWFSASLDCGRTIGHLEVTKHEFIQHYLKENT